MSQFEQHLLAAKRRQRRLLLGGLFGVLVLAAVILSILLVTRATRIDILPEEVTASANTEVMGGLAFIIGKTLYALGGRPAVTVSADGFYTRQQALAENDFGKVMTITLKPLPAELVLRSPENDNRTKWLLGEELYFVGDELVRELEPGDVTISIMHPYYEVKDLNLSLGRGERLERTVELEPITGELVVTTKPAAARLTINQEQVGNTPTTVSLPGGEYRVQVSLDTFEPIDETIEITREASRVQRDYRLEPEKGQLNVSLSPAGGKLVLNNLQVEPRDTYRLAVNKPHTLTYSKLGYFSQTKKVNVNSTTETTVRFALEQETGQVELTATPAAQVTVNGENRGSTPLTLTLDAVSQEIEFTKPGFRPVTQTVIPSSKTVKKLSVNLVPERVATLQEAPSSYQHPAGGTMKLYKPGGTFTVGAARSEPGQRANEFLKTVRLTRPFYAGVNEVTYAVYNRFDPNKSGQANYPVTGLSWLEAARFCNWLSQQEGRQPVYQLQGNNFLGVNDDADGYRLLTEAEWEWLARQANRQQQTRFVWGDNTVIPKNTVNIADESARGSARNVVPKYNDGYAGVAPTGSFDQELSGLFDQGGNVSEWVHDAYSLMPPKPGQIFTDPFDTGRGDSRVIKGASWQSGTLTELRASWREGLSTPREDVGFRIGRYVYGGESP